MFNQVLERFQKNFVALFIIGAVAAGVIHIPSVLVQSVFAGAGAFAAMTNPTSIMSTLMSGASLMSLITTILVGAVVMMVLYWILGAWADGVLFSAARDATAGAAPELNRSVAEGGRFFSRFLVYRLLVGLTFLVLGIPVVIPILGILWALVLLVASLVLGPAFAYFGKYALLAEDLDAMAAYQRAWAGARKRLGDHFVAGLLWLVMAIVFGIVSSILSLVLGIIPIIGIAIAAIAVGGISGPFITLFMANHYLTAVRPHLAEGQPM